MRKTFKADFSIGRGLAATALAGSLALFGCSTNRTPGYGEPAMSSPAAGSMAPNASSTPGSANTMGTMPNGPAPQAMISSSPANGESRSVDAIADLKAAEGYQGKYLGPAAPGDNSVPSLSSQIQTGQFISPSLYANPQSTVNSSISSAPTPAIVSGAGGDAGGGVVFTTGATIAGTGSTGATSAAVMNGVQNVGVTGVSNTTATPITNNSVATTAVPGAATTVNPSALTNNQVVGNGMVNSIAAGSNAAATPVLTTIGAVGNTNAASAATLTGGSVLGVTNVAPTTLSATPTVGATAAVTNTAATATTNTASGAVAPVRATSTRTATTATNALTTRARAITTRGSAAVGATGAVRVVTTSNGTVLMTNQSGTATGSVSAVPRQ